MSEQRVYPGTLAQALNDGKINRGDRLLLHAGTYTGDFTCTLAGVAILPYPGEHAVIDGSLMAGGVDNTWQDVEIVFSGWITRKTGISGSAPKDIPTTKTISMVGTGSKFINCVIHDTAGPGSLGAGVGTEIYGCVIYFNGWSGPDRGHGHGMYLQNITPTKTVKDCIIFDNFGYGIHAYTEGGKIDNLLLDGCTCFRNGSLYSDAYNNILVGGYQVANHITIRDCMTYDAAGVNIGYIAGAEDVILTDNYFQDGIAKVNTTPTESGNYYGAAIGNQVFLWANTYDATRANLVIYNQNEDKTVDVDVSAVFGKDGIVKAHNVQDYWKDVQTLTIASNSITVNMQAVNRTVATPVQWTAPATTFPQFGTFVLEKI